MNDKEDSKWADLETFSRVGTKRGEPYISISPNRFFTFSAGFVHQAKDQIGNNSYVLLLYSKSQNAIVFEFTNNDKQSGALKFSKNINAIVSARSFFNFYNIDIQKYAGKYLAKKENIPSKGNQWVVYLNEPLKKSS